MRGRYRDAPGNFGVSRFWVLAWWRVRGLIARMRFGTALGVTVALLAAGCGKEEVRVYEVAKETNAAPVVASAPATPAMDPGSVKAPAARTPKAPWTIPPEWQERPNASGMRLASYGVTAPDGRSVDISVTALGEQAGTELENVNRWRGQVKLAPLTEDQLPTARDPVKVGTESAHVYDMVSQEAMLDGKYKTRVLATILPAGGMTVFFKATGEADLVAGEKQRFIGWLASVRTGPEGEETEAPNAPAAAAAPEPPPRPAVSAPSAPDLPPGPAAGLPKWEVPSHWRRGGARAMRLASFEIPGAGAEVGDVSISTLSSGGGGLLPNVNRWRGQVGLGSTDEATLAKEATKVTLKGGQEATVVDLGGKGPTRILGAIVPDGDKSWFFKLTGPDALVAKERENFVGWLKSMQL